MVLTRLSILLRSRTILIMGAPIVSSMYFLDHDPLYDTEKLYELKYDPPGDLPRTNMKLSKWDDVQLHDIRGHENSVTFQSHGFCLLQLASQMTQKDFDNREKVETVYLQEVGHTLQNALSARRVQVFDYQVRRFDAGVKMC